MFDDLISGITGRVADRLVQQSSKHVLFAVVVLAGRGSTHGRGGSDTAHSSQPSGIVGHQETCFRAATRVRHLTIPASGGLLACGMAGMHSGQSGELQREGAWGILRHRAGVNGS